MSTGKQLTALLLLTTALTFPAGAGSKICMQPEKGAEAGRRCIGPSFAAGCPADTKNGFSLSHRTGLYLLVKKKGPKLTRQANS